MPSEQRELVRGQPLERRARKQDAAMLAGGGWRASGASLVSKIGRKLKDLL